MGAMILRQHSGATEKREGRSYWWSVGGVGRSGWDWVLDWAAGRYAVVHGCWPNRDVGGVFGAEG